MGNPYSDRPLYTFWRQGVADAAAAGVDPVIRPAFTINRDDAIATAGSCFAQHIAKTLVKDGFNYLITESFQPLAGVSDESFGIFPARFSNIYTPRQLVQLFDRAYGGFQPKVNWWEGGAGKIDPFRPKIQEAGFDTVENLLRDRDRHLAAVRSMFETCRVFIFTLGLTEAWISKLDGSVYPLSPGVVGATAAEETCGFYNFGVAEVAEDLIRFQERLACLNPSAKILLTVSPVPLVATYEDRHVLVSTIASKSILRAAVEEVVRKAPNMAYFPAYEIITGPQARGRYFGPDLREVTPEGVSRVMSLFSRYYLCLDEPVERSSALQESGSGLSEADEQRMREIMEIICDEEAIVR